MPQILGSSYIAFFSRYVLLMHKKKTVLINVSWITHGVRKWKPLGYES